MNQITHDRRSWTPARHLSIGPVPARRKNSARLWLFLTVLLAVCAAGAAYWWYQREVDAGQSKSGPQPGAGESPALRLNLPDPDLVRPLAPEEAVAANQERPFDAPPDNPAVPFLLRSDAISRLRAIDCLTQAVYYEAASEGVDGGRAVAQVVLNRVRHPAYPNSVCGVVYQGSERRTGCQFTFTCDGSLLRPPSAYLWARSNRIAQEALAGRVFAPVGHSTHYHADYVLPYWADSLYKMAQIGRHIFYRLRGSLGTRPAFNQRHAGQEPAPSAPVAPELVEPTALPATETDPLEVIVEEDRVEALRPTPQPEIPSESQLSADLARGTLMIDGEAPPPAAPASRRGRSPALQDGCDNQGRGKRIEAIGAADLRAGGGQAC